MPAIVFARATVAVHVPAGIIHVSEGDPWAADDPLVRERPELFGADCSRPRRSEPALPQVEAATRAPGERRRG